MVAHIKDLAAGEGALVIQQADGSQAFLRAEGVGNGVAAQLHRNMTVTVALGHIFHRHIGSGHAAAPDIVGAQVRGQTAAVQTIAHFVHFRAQGEFGVLIALQRAGHHPGPQLQRGVGRELLQALGLVKAEPHYAHVIGRDAREPAVVVGAGGTGLAAHVHAADGGLAAGAVGDDACEQLDHVIPGLGGHGHGGHRLVVDEKLAVRVIDLGVQNGRGVLAVVDKGAVGGGHLQHGDALGERTHGKGADILVAVGLDAAVAEGLAHGFHQAGQPQVFGGPVKGAFHAQLLQQVHRHSVVGFCDTVQDGGAAAVGAAFVIGPAGAVAADGKVLGHVVHHGNGGHQAVFQSRGVDGDGLDGRTGAAVGLGGPVEDQITLFFAAAAVQGLYLTGIGIHKHHGGLGIGTVIAQAAGEVVLILEDRVHFGLDHGVQGGHDLQTAAVQQLLGHACAVAQLGLQVGFNRRDDGILEIGLIAAAVILFAGVLIGLHILRHGLVVLGLADVAVLLHGIEHRGPPLGVFFGEALQIVAVGIFDDSGDGGAFCQGQVLQVLVEIRLGRLMHTVGALAEVDGVEIHL